MNVNTTVGNKKANQISECLCCNVKLNHPGAIKEHFSSKKHMNKWIRYVQENEIQLTPEFSLEESGQVNDKNIVPPINQYMQGPQTYTCNVCQILLESKSLKETHVKEFPHADLLDLRRMLMRKGSPYNLYALLQKKYIHCWLCQITMTNTSGVQSHCSSEIHNIRERLLLVNPIVIPEYVSKWYYCKFCNQNLDGTSDSDNHIHYVTQTRVSSGNTGTNVVQYANAGPNFITDFPKLLDTKTSGSPKQAQLPDNAGQNKPNLRAQIFTELEKLVQTLYYSKKLPDQVSLDYIKKINQEVEILIEKHQKSNYVQTNTINKSETKTVKSPVTGSGDENKITTNEVKPQVQAKSASEIKAQENVLKKPQTSKQDTPFSSLLTQIVDEKHRLQKAGHRNDAKKLDVLSEIEILLLQISKPELPHQEILDCLKTFNGIIDLDCKKKQSCQPCNGM